MTRKSTLTLTAIMVGLGLLALIAVSANILLARSSLRHALNVDSLPSSTWILGSGGESWTDYLFEGNVRVSPSQVEELLQGRKFKREVPLEKIVRSDWIPGFPPLTLGEYWHWETAEGDIDFAACSVWVNEDRSRVFVRYMSD